MKFTDEARKQIDILLEIKHKFLTNKDIDVAFYQLMYDVIDFFDIDRIFIAMKSVFNNECAPLVEYIKDEQPNFFGEVLNFDGFTKFSDVKVQENELACMKICDENNYFLGDEFDKLKDVLPNIGYLPSKKGNPSECLMFYIKNKESFSYMMIERYEEKEEYLSKTEKMAIEDIYSVWKSKIEKGVLEERLYNEMHMKNLIIENEQTPICLVEKTENRVIYFNDNYEQIMPNVTLGAVYYDLFQEEDTYELLKQEKSLVLKKYSLDTFKYWIRKVIPFTLADNTEVYMVYIKNTEDYIKELEGIDLLTTAYSMTGFVGQFKNLINKNFDEDYALCTIDISKFKYINDAYGFTIGNKILKKIAIVLTKFTRKQEFFCRMNEDKFAMILQASSKEELQARINVLFEKLEIMKKEHFLDMKLTYMCGITFVKSDIELNILIDRANSARTSVKGSHKSVLAFFDEEAEKRIKNELSIEARISKAVENGEFVPYLQPKFNLQDMTICGAEALVRWITPTGMIFPDSFIPLFEKNGFIDTLDFIIYKKVMEHIRNCLDRNLEVYPISLNVSRNHIYNKNFINQIMDLIHTYRIPINLIELEITESVFVEDREVLKYFIDNIKRPKIKVSIDDFGTAYSSLQVLKDIDIDILKIDKGFIDNIDFSDKRNFTKDEVVLKNIINLARDLDCKVICEGIESTEQVEMLKEIGCELGQGYLFAKPMPIEEYESRFLK